MSSLSRYNRASHRRVGHGFKGHTGSPCPRALVGPITGRAELCDAGNKNRTMSRACSDQRPFKLGGSRGRSPSPQVIGSGRARLWRAGRKNRTKFRACPDHDPRKLGGSPGPPTLHYGGQDGLPYPTL